MSQAIYSRAKEAWARKGCESQIWRRPFGYGWPTLVFPTIRKKMVGGNLKALICGIGPADA